MISDLKNIFGLKCTAININGELHNPVGSSKKRLKLCEAVKLSFEAPIVVTKNNLGCPGARRSIGYDKDDELLAGTISKNNGIPVPFILNALKKIPKLDGITHINMGLTEDMEPGLKPDLFIVYTNPAMITAIMHNLAKVGVIPSILPFSLLSVCGNVFSNCYKNNVPTMSFGCPESRKHGGISNTEVVLGLPFYQANQLINVF
ncbi:MAG: DUF169 domain-containing protein [Prolixibacteraceae bacterium]|nr:DUF169 domain-containing protein [Prolixibacteraceae bacterium]